MKIKDKYIKNVSVDNKNGYRELIKGISGIAREISIVQKQAKKLGIFSDLRDLLKCKKCGLMEDILCDGRLVTYYEGKQIDDTGLRFNRKRGGIYYCPKCGFKIEKAKIMPAMRSFSAIFRPTA